MTESDPSHLRVDVRLSRRMLVGGALFAAGLSRAEPARVFAASKPIDVPGAVAGIASPFANDGFTGNSAGFYYTPLGGTTLGGLTADQGNAVANGLKAGFYFPLFERVVEGASGKGYDAYFFANGLLFDSSKHATAAAKALLAVELPSGVTPANEKLSDGSSYSSYEWSGSISGFTAGANVHRGVAVSGTSLFAIDWADFTGPPSSDEIANLKSGIAGAIDANRTGVPLGEGVLRINDAEQVVFNILKGSGASFGEFNDHANTVEVKYASTARTYVRGLDALSVLASGNHFSIVTEELTFSSANDAKSFFASRRDLIQPLDAQLGRTRVKSEPESGIEGADETTGDFILSGNPNGVVAGADVTVRYGARVLSVAFTNSGLVLPVGTSVTSVDTNVLAEAAGLATRSIQALKIGTAGDAVYNAGFGRAVQGGAL